MSTENSPYVRVAAKSSPYKVAGAICAILRRKETAYVQAIGSEAEEVATRALLIAAGWLAEEGVTIDADYSRFAPDYADSENPTGTRYTVTAEYTSPQQA